MQFQNSAQKCSQLIQFLKTDLNKRDQLKQAGKTTGLIDAEINGTLKALDTQLDQLNQTISQPDLLAKEVQRRRNTYHDLSSQRVELKKRIELQYVQHQREVLFKDRKDTPNNYESFGSVDLLNLHKQVTSRQDEQLGRINDKAIGIKYSTQSIGNNIIEQNKLIDTLTVDATYSYEAMNKVKNKMQRFVDSSSSYGLVGVISLELILLLIIIII